MDVLLSDPQSILLCDSEPQRLTFMEQVEESKEGGIPRQIKLPKNLFIIGTVNIDETTNMFSPKVLDRANSIEFRVTKEEMENFLEK